MGCCDCSTRNGMMNVLAAVCMTFAWCFNVAAFSVCRFVRNESGFFEDPINREKRVIQYAGLYTFGDGQGYCYAINWNETTSQWDFWTDGKLNSARACGGMAALIGLIIFVWMWFAMCCNCGRVNCVRKVFGFFALVCAVLSGLMFLIYQSYLCDGQPCGFSQGGGFTVASLVLYFLASVLCCAAPDADERLSDPTLAGASASGGGTSTVVVEKTEMADGTVVEKKTTTHPDGSKTVEEKKIEPVPEGPMDEEEAVENMPKAQVN